MVLSMYQTLCWALENMVMDKPIRLVGGHRQVYTAVWEVLQQGKYRELREPPEGCQTQTQAWGIMEGSLEVMRLSPEAEWGLVRHTE